MYGVHLPVLEGQYYADEGNVFPDKVSPVISKWSGVCMNLFGRMFYVRLDIYGEGY